MAKILVVAEQMQGELKKATLNAITLAKALSERVGGGYDIVVAGSGVNGVAAELAAYGAEKVYSVDAPELAHYLAQPYTKAVAAAVAHSGAQFIVGPSDTYGKDLLPRVAAATGAGMVADCIALAGDGELLFKRPMYAGNVVATVRANTETVVVSVRTTAFDAAQASGGGSAVESVAYPGGEHQSRFISFDGTESERPELTDAEVVVCGGRGLKDGTSFYELLNPLADVLNAGIGASRAVVDGMPEVPNDLQIGQTGKVVAPNLYFAVAISGAIQHLAGMKNSKTIVAINTNPDEPIFQVADYGLVADAFQAVPELVEEVKKAQA